MSLRAGVTIEQEAATRTWVETFFKEYDSPDIQQWVMKYFQLDAIVHIRDLPPMKAHKELCDYIKEEHAQTPIIRHDIKYVDVLSDRVYVQKNSTGIVKNDPEQKEITAKLFCVFSKKVDEDKISGFDAYFDATCLIERIKMYSSNIMERWSINLLYN